MRSAPLLLLATTAAQAITSPNTSFATVPVGYFGGNTATRPESNIEMLAKMRIVMLEKWEGRCWSDCFANGPGSPACASSCDVESDMLDTFRRVKALNPAVSTVFYLNTLLAFPFYKFTGKMQRAGGLLGDSKTGQPVIVRNDNGMAGIYVFGFDSAVGRALYIEAVRNLTATGLVDGFFGDKWGSEARLDAISGEWQVCSHECGTVTEAQAHAFNAGKAQVLREAVALVGLGPYFENGAEFINSDVPSGPPVIGTMGGLWNGGWSGRITKYKDPRYLIRFVQQKLAVHPYKYVWLGTCDQHWTHDPTDIEGMCRGDCLARFLLAVEEGVFLGANGWQPEYGYSLGEPLGPAMFTTASPESSATLTREFASGTSVRFEYNADETDGRGTVMWAGHSATTPEPTPGFCGDLLFDVEL